MLDDQGYNVALNKPVTASALQAASNICLASGCLASGGNNGIIDNTVGNSDGYISASNQGDAFWQVDLQGLYSISRVIFWNRADGTTYANRLINATITLFNGNGAAIGQTLLGSGLVQQWYPITYFAPTGTPTQVSKLTGCFYTHSTKCLRCDVTFPIIRHVARRLLFVPADAFPQPDSFTDADTLQHTQPKRGE